MQHFSGQMESNSSLFVVESAAKVLICMCGFEISGLPVRMRAKLQRTGILTLYIIHLNIATSKLIENCGFP